eukprot:ctg_4335.g580
MRVSSSTGDRRSALELAAAVRASEAPHRSSVKPAALWCLRSVARGCLQFIWAWGLWRAFREEVLWAGARPPVPPPPPASGRR